MSSRFSRDVAWNVVGLGVAGACGILLNTLISLVYDVAALGVFNQVFAFYLVFSQFAALGVHYSVLKHVAATDDVAAQRAIVTSALQLTAAIGAGFAIAFALVSPLAGAVVDSDEVATGILYAAPGVLCFALNKVTLGALNGLRRMRIYAVLFAGRFVLMVGGFAICVALDVDRAALPVLLSGSELVILVLSLPALRDVLGGVPRDERRGWRGRHVRFGLKGFMSGMFAELNTRVDVMILGAFAADGVVGAYSFAAILAEGLFQLLVVLRNNYAPILVRLWAQGSTGELVATIARARNRIYLAAVAVGAVAVGGYVIALPLITSQPDLLDSGPYFAALIAGMVASAGYTPFQPLLLYGGYPGWHTWLMIAIVAINAIANFVLIVALGPVGSAIATALAFVAGVGLLRILVGARMQLRI